MASNHTLVAGASGQIGSHLVTLLQQAAGPVVHWAILGWSNTGSRCPTHC